MSDVVIRGDVPAEIRRSMERVEVEPWRIYKVDEAHAYLAETGVDVDRLAPQVDGKVASAFFRAQKPTAKSCCGPDCCA